MLQNFITIAIRNLNRDKIHAGINIFGLAIGIMCCLLIFLYIKQELGYNQSYKDSDRIYKVLRETVENTGSRSFNERTSGPLGAAIKEQFPEVEDVLRLYRRDAWVTVNGHTFAQTICTADLNIFDFLGLNLSSGDLQTALSDPNKVLINEQQAKVMFGDTNPIGQTIQVEAYLFNGEYTVAGIFKDLPRTSTLQFEILLGNTKIINYPLIDVWRDTGWRLVETYIKLPPLSDTSALQTKMQSLITQHLSPEVAARNHYHLQPFESIYLYSAPQYHIAKADFGVRGLVYGSIDEVRMASLIAIFILLIACVNFINLSTARSARRAREVGLRKTVGASRRSIALQFLGESILLSSLATLLALGFVKLTLPAFNNFVGKSLSLDLIHTPVLFVLPIALSMIVGIIAGIYPAFYLSAFEPNEVLKTAQPSRQGGDRLRKSLVIFQFAISIILIIGTLIGTQQLNYMRHKNLGFDREKIVVLPLFHRLSGRKSYDLKKRYNTVKQAFLKHPDVTMASVSRFAFGRWAPISRFQAEGKGDQVWQFRLFPVEEDFIPFFGIKLLAGKNFVREHAELSYGERQERNKEEMFILNQAAAKLLGWDNPIGKRLTWGKGPGTVIGLIEDVHFQNLREVVEPTIMVSEFDNLKQLYLKVEMSNFPELLNFLQTTWKQFLPNRPFEYSFLNDRLDELYAEESRLTRIFMAFSILAIFISCLGLFGLASFMAEQRTKEIGIRKVLGASIGNITTILIQDFAKLIAISAIISLPIIYYFTQNWLANFPYRIDLTYTPFILGTALAFAVAFIAVGYQALSAALTNPVDALKYE